MMLILTNILTPLPDSRILFEKNRLITINAGVITKISELSDEVGWIDKSNFICIPGMIDSHVHLSQFYQRGKHSPDLISWLNRFTFPEERKSKDANFSRKIAQDFFDQSLKKGTTTTVVYTSPYRQACEIAFEVAQKKKVRSIIGMTMMDMNCPEYLKQTTDEALKNSYDLWLKWHDQGLLDYIFSPRFAITCSLDLLKETGKMIKNMKARLQTHLAENQVEIDQVKILFPDFKSYTELYYKSGILGNRSIMGHAIHLDNKEVAILADTESGVAFCPDSNFFLKSGHFDWHKLKSKKIKIGIASDVGAGTDLSMLKMMKYASYILETGDVDADELFYRSTLGNAELLGLENILGSIEVDKEADLVFLQHENLELENLDKSEILSLMIYLNHEIIIDSTWIQGQELYHRN